MKHAFIAQETGAVTVDWVVLTAGLVGLGLATLTMVSGGVQDTSGDINDQLTKRHIGVTMMQFTQPQMFDNVLAVAAAADGLTDVNWGNARIWSHGPENHLEWQEEQVKEYNDSYLQTYLNVRAPSLSTTPAMQALDRDNLTAGDIATAMSMSESTVQTQITNQAGGDIQNYYDARLAFSQMRTDEYAYGAAEAERRGMM